LVFPITSIFDIHLLVIVRSSWILLRLIPIPCFGIISFRVSSGTAVMAGEQVAVEAGPGCPTCEVVLIHFDTHID